VSEPNVAAVLPVFDQVIGFMEEALKESTARDEQIAHLKASLSKLQSDQERITLEKVATARATFFDKTATDTMLSKLEGMGIIDTNNREKIARRITDDPNYILPLIIKVAETLMSAPGEGSGVDAKEASMLDVPDTGDPDGWWDMAEGKPVAVKK
jgi:hypothetical protein